MLYQDTETNFDYFSKSTSVFKQHAKQCLPVEYAGETYYYCYYYYYHYHYYYFYYYYY